MNYDDWKLMTPEEDFITNSTEIELGVQFDVVCRGYDAIQDARAVIKKYLQPTNLTTKFDIVEDDFIVLRVDGLFQSYLSDNWTEKDILDECIGLLKQEGLDVDNYRLK